MRATNYGGSASACANASERRATFEKDDARADPPANAGKVDTTGETSDEDPQPPRRGSADSYVHKASVRNTGSPTGVVCDHQPKAREGRFGRCRVAEGSVVPLKPAQPTVVTSRFQAQ
jgi:hypothetical protein